MKRTLIIALGFLLFFGLVNCSAQSSTNDQRIVGTWICTDSEEGFTATVVFNANGSGSVSYEEGDEKYNGPFTYGISVTGELMYLSSNWDVVEILSDIVGIRRGGGKYYFSPDGRVLMFNNYAFRKR
jgi:hypothetical protein